MKMKKLEGWVTYLQVAPLALVFLLFLVVPIATIVVVSFFDYDTVRIIPAFLWQNYDELLTSPVTWQTYLQTLEFAAMTWALTLLIGFTVAYFLAFHVQSATWQTVLFLVCTIPFWTSNIIRMISWIPFLGRNGLLNTALFNIGIIHQPLEFLLFSDFAVVLAYVHLYTLFMVAARGGARRRRERLADAVERYPAAVQARHRHRLDLRRHHRDGRFRDGAPDERRPDRVGRPDDDECDVAAAVSRGRGQCRDPAAAGADHRGRDDAAGRHPQGAVTCSAMDAGLSLSGCLRPSSRCSCCSSTVRPSPS
jgi:hypothetical protein